MTGFVEAEPGSATFGIITVDSYNPATLTITGSGYDVNGNAITSLRVSAQPGNTHNVTHRLKGGR